MDLPDQALQGFAVTGLSPVILSILERAQLTVPTPIQAKAIPVALQKSDLIGVAQTGTGKTLAFTLPILERLLQEPGRALILVPTRELALQVEESIRKVSRFLNPGIRTISLIGGMPIYRQIKDLKYGPRIIVATPGRLRDHLDQKTLELGDVQILVLDEADRMLDMGFLPQIKRVLEILPPERQTMLFSATMAPEVASLAHTYLKNPVRIEVALQGSSNKQILQELCYVQHDEKLDLLHKVLGERDGSALIFSRTKHGAGKLNKKLQDLGYTSTEIHSNRSMGQRKQALDGFKAGKYRLLVATDVAARGIDVQDISLVVNFDLPDAAEDYVHRIGRTGRAGSTGTAISFATPDQHRDVKSIERLMNNVLPISTHSRVAVDKMSYGSDRSQPRPQRSYNSSNSSSYSSRPNSSSSYSSASSGNSRRWQGNGSSSSSSAGRSRPTYKKLPTRRFGE